MLSNKQDGLGYTSIRKSLRRVVHKEEGPRLRCWQTPLIFRQLHAIYTHSRPIFFSKIREVLLSQVAGYVRRFFTALLEETIGLKQIHLQWKLKDSRYTNTVSP